MPEVHVIVASPEEGYDGIAEFWSEGKLVALTVIHEGQLHLRIDAPGGYGPLLVQVSSLARGLAEAERLLAAV